MFTYRDIHEVEKAIDDCGIILEFVKNKITGV